MENEYFKPEYDCIIIGSALAGMTAAITLRKKGFKNILILERQNMPGGVTTSFVRGGVELEASLHEMSSVSSEECPLSVRKFLKENGIHVDWIRSDVAYRYVEPGIDCTIHAGTHGDYEKAAHDIAEAVGDPNGEIYERVLMFFTDCKKVYDSITGLADGKLLDIKLIENHIDLIRGLGYSVEQVIKAYHLPPKVEKILSAYWSYLGNTPDDLPYILYSYIIADYIGYGPYLCKKTSHELSLAMADCCERNGIQIEYHQEVEKILVSDNHVVGVKLKNGQVLYTNYVISGAYPNHVYTHMIEPQEAVPKNAYQMVNSRQMGATVFSMIMVLDKSPEELGLDTYMTFYAPSGMNYKKIMKSYHNSHDYKYTMNVCMNIANPDCSPKGTTVYSITALPYPDGWKNVNVYNYNSWKERIGKELLEMESQRLGISLKDHIKEIEFITPVSIAHYSHSFRGCIYGYMSCQNDSIGARIMTHNDELFIPGLAFAGAHQYAGDGMGPAINNGMQAALDILSQLNKDVPAPLQKLIIKK
ncbi:MAG: FAD-dependent oxidoreductase [Bacilli bacterium]|nr:FAD-dependent oxidoreductase [Bacilli bacterium]